MAGVKGRSGRKGYAFHDIEAKQVQEIVALSFQTILKFLKSPEYPIDKKAQLASEFMKRRIANKQEVELHSQVSAEDKAYIETLFPLGRAELTLPSRN